MEALQNIRPFVGVVPHRFVLVSPSLHRLHLIRSLRVKAAVGLHRCVEPAESSRRRPAQRWGQWRQVSEREPYRLSFDSIECHVQRFASYREGASEGASAIPAIVPIIPNAEPAVASTQEANSPSASGSVDELATFSAAGRSVPARDMVRTRFCRRRFAPDLLATPDLRLGQ